MEGYDWEQRKLNSIVDRVKSYSLSRGVETKEYTGYKYIHYGDIHTKVADIIDDSSNLPNINTGDYDLLRKGDIVLADASEDYQGIATPAVITIDLPYKLVAGLHTIALRPKEVDSLFLYYLIYSPIFRKYGYKVGTGMKVFGISAVNLLKFEGMFPLLEEQIKIGNFLRKLDNLIALHQRKLDKLEQLKKGFMQVMFPQNGKDVPKLRFTDFNCKWKQCQLNDILEERNEQMPANEKFQLMSFTATEGVTPKSDRYNREFLVKSKNKKYKKTEKGDLIYSSNNLEVGSIGLNNMGNAVISPVYSIFRVKDGITSNFMGVLILRKQFINKMLRYRQGVVYGQWKIHEADFLNIQTLIPSSEEQRRIGNYFKQLDDTIALHRTKLDKLQVLKKAYLQKIFI